MSSEQGEALSQARKQAEQEGTERMGVWKGPCFLQVMGKELRVGGGEKKLEASSKAVIYLILRHLFI